MGVSTILKSVSFGGPFGCPMMVIWRFTGGTPLRLAFQSRKVECRFKRLSPRWLQPLQNLRYFPCGPARSAVCYFYSRSFMKLSYFLFAAAATLTAADYAT